jgi:hypothetical protein
MIMTRSVYDPLDISIEENIAEKIKEVEERIEIEIEWLYFLRRVEMDKEESPENLEKIKHCFFLKKMRKRANKK